MPVIYLATVLIELNRWGSRIPSVSMGEWIPRIREAGFDGLEVWENHVLDRPGDIKAVQSGGFPALLNTYLTFCDDDPARVDAVVNVITALQSPAVKFNINGGCSLDVHRKHLLAFAARLPDGCRMLCECHAGTPLEDVHTAETFLDSLPPERFGAILHGFGEPGAVLARYRALRRHIAHIHIQTRTEDKTSGRFAANAKGLRDNGFTGAWSIEFTESSRNPDETVEMSFAHACEDLADLRNALKE